MNQSKMLQWLAAMAVASGLCLQACSQAVTSPEGGSPTSTSMGTGTGTGTTTRPPATSPSNGSPVGKWLSPACGERTYPRVLDLVADGTFSCADLVSPCPPEAVCVWSGIITRTGTYTVAGDRITLEPSEKGSQQWKPLPTLLGLDPATGAPFELNDGGKACAYVRKE